MPTPNISRMIPISASSVATPRSAMRPGREGPDDDARDDVADDRGELEALGDEAADEGGDQADREGRDQNGLVVHGSSRDRGCCAGLARVRARTTAGWAPSPYPTGGPPARSGPSVGWPRPLDPTCLGRKQRCTRRAGRAILRPGMQEIPVRAFARGPPGLRLRRDLRGLQGIGASWVPRSSYLHPKQVASAGGSGTAAASSSGREADWWRWGRVELPVQDLSPETTTSVSDGLSSTGRAPIGRLPVGPVTCP